VLAGIEGGSRKAVARNLTMFDVRDYWDGWARNGPPAYITAAAAAGWKPAEEKTQEQQFDDLVRMLGAG
jgi:hypothetical protein